jgi:hypothetical protein
MTKPLAKYFCKKGYTHRIGRVPRKSWAAAVVRESTSERSVTRLWLTLLVLVKNTSGFITTVCK